MTSKQNLRYNDTVNAARNEENQRNRQRVTEIQRLFERNVSTIDAAIRDTFGDDE